MSRATGGDRRAEGEARDLVTFLGRGLATRSGGKLVLHVCPLCSQRNGHRGAERGVCEWCAYQPALCDIQPCDTEPVVRTERAA